MKADEKMLCLLLACCPPIILLMTYMEDNMNHSYMMDMKAQEAITVKQFIDKYNCHPSRTRPTELNDNKTRKTCYFDCDNGNFYDDEPADKVI